MVPSEPSEPPTSTQSPSSIDLSKKRKRNASNAPTIQTSGLIIKHSTSLISKDTPAGAFRPSTPETDEERTSPLLDRILTSDDRAGSSSPRTAAARHFSKLAIQDRSTPNENRRSDRPAQSPIEPQPPQLPPISDAKLDSITAIRLDDTATPPPKRVPPPRGIKSPKPVHRSSPFKLPTLSPSSSPTNTNTSPLSVTSSQTTTSPATDTPLFEFDFKTLSWQDSEITGHLMSDPEDDGYGINGIGFKPTPAMAMERSQRRRRQMAEWRARQTREERERRAERRRGLAKNFEAAQQKKVVRFTV